MDQYEYEPAICIGDNITDYSMALVSDMVFARDSLAEMPDASKISDNPWLDFYDLVRSISSSR